MVQPNDSGTIGVRFGFCLNSIHAYAEIHGMYICVYIYIHAYVYVQIYIYTYTYVRIHIYTATFLEVPLLRLPSVKELNCPVSLYSSLQACCSIPHKAFYTPTLPG